MLEISGAVVFLWVSDFQEATGQTGEDWQKLIEWIAETKGEEKKEAFVRRCQEPL